MTSIIKVDTVQDIDGNNIISENANTITIGASGDTISIPAGATLVNNGTATGFGLTTQSVQTTGFTAVKGNLYPCNTTSAAFTVTLPASPSVGDQIGLLDYAGTWDSNVLTINPNSNKIIGQTSSVVASKDREAITLTYIDSTQGWLPNSGYQEGTTGIATPYSIDFLVIAGGASGGVGGNSGGGGAGGYRTSTQTVNGGTVITVTVGEGGAGVVFSPATPGNSGSNSSISGSGLTTITSAGGGAGAKGGPTNGLAGGSGGGGGEVGAGGAGNTPSTSPSQGNNGGAGVEIAPAYGAGGGGGAGAAGSNGTSSKGGDGGNGTASSITGSSVTRAGGGGGGTDTTIGSGGTGGGGNGAPHPGGSGVAGTANTGSGGGAGDTNGTSGAGGKGVVILSMPTVSYSSTTTGSPTVTTSGSNTILQFNGSGSYTT